MSQPDAEDRERAVQALTERNEIQRRIDRTRQQLRAIQNIVQDIAEREALLQSLAADQAALVERIEVMGEFKAQMRREEERIRRKTEEALRLHAEWKSCQFSNSFPSGSAPSSDGQMFGFFLIVAVFVLGMLVLFR